MTQSKKFRLDALPDGHGMSGKALTNLRTQARDAILVGEVKYPWPAEAVTYHDKCAWVGIPTKRNGLPVSKKPTKANVAAWKALTGFVEPSNAEFPDGSKVTCVIGGTIEIATVLRTKADGNIEVEFDDQSIGFLAPDKLKLVTGALQDEVDKFTADEEPDEEPESTELFTGFDSFGELTPGALVVKKLSHPARKSMSRKDGIDTLIDIGWSHDDASAFVTQCMHKSAPK